MEEFDKTLGKLVDAESDAKRLAEGDGRQPVVPALSFSHSYISYLLLITSLLRDSLLLSDTLTILRKREARLIASFTQKLLTPSHSSHRRYRKSKGATMTIKQQRESFDMKLLRKRAKVYPILVKLLSGIIASWESLRDLRIVVEDSGPSQASAEGGEYQEISDLVSAIEAQISLAKAKRILFLGRIYGLMLEQFAEGMDLIEKGRSYIKEGRKAWNVNFQASESLGKFREEEEIYKIEGSEWEDLEREFTEDWNKIGRIWFERKRAEEGSHEDHQPFLDIVYNYVVEFDLHDIGEWGGVPGKKKKAKQIATTRAVKKEEPKKPEVDKETAPEPQQSSGGFWGFFGMSGRK